MVNSLLRSLPLHTALRSASVCSASRRCFSQTVLQRAIGNGRMQAQRPAQRPERSLRALSKEMAGVPNDVGLLDGTFVAPTGPNAPSLFKDPRNAFFMLKKRLTTRFQDQVMRLILKWSSPRGKRWYQRPLKLSHSSIVPTAVALHRQMYLDFAAGDAAALRRICVDGVYESFRARIGGRARGEKVVWELVKYNKGAKLMSNRASKLPLEGAAIRQAVVRICSRQRLTRWVKDKSGKPEIVPGSGKEKDVIEYVVIQRKYEHWKEEPWQVWGTTTETTLGDVLEWQRRAAA